MTRERVADLKGCSVILKHEIRRGDGAVFPPGTRAVVTGTWRGVFHLDVEESKDGSPLAGHIRMVDRGMFDRATTGTLTDERWRLVFRLRCKSKSGDALGPKEMSLIRRAAESDPDRYHAMEADVFDATVPFGSNAKAKR